MSESGWGAPDWRSDGERREGLPQIEDLPIAEQGYDQEAVGEAFDRFYRHAAQLDATLRVLESVEAFSRQARDLRADIRSLRAASWGPAPSARHVWSVGHATWAPEEPPGALAASLPRLAVWAALIVAVGVGAALADLGTLLIVALVLAAWALVGLTEVVIASRRAGRVPVPLAAPEPAPVAAAPAAAEPVPAPAGVEGPAPQPSEAAVVPQETMISGPVSDGAEAPDAATPDEDAVAPPQQEAPEALPVAELEPVAEVEPEPAAEAQPAPHLEPAPAVEPVVEALPAAEAEPGAEEDALGGSEAAAYAEPGAEEDALGGPEPAAEPAPRRAVRFWRRREEPEPAAEDTDPDLRVTDLPPGGWQADEQAGDPWEQGVEENGEDESLEAAAPPSRGLLRRGRR